MTVSTLKRTIPLNQILFGPPGTGKTYSTVTKALEVLDPVFLEEVTNNVSNQEKQRQQIKQRFDELHEQGRVRLVTFHQSFSYEDFVEGIRAVVDEEDASSLPRFVIEKGVFVELCDAARQNPEQDAELGVREDAAVWKLSIGELKGEIDTREYCFTHNEMRIGWPDAGNLTTLDYRSHPALSAKNKSALSAFSTDAEEGDIVLCFAGNSTISAVGVVTGAYRYEPQVPEAVREDFVHVRPVRWLIKNISFSVKELNANKALVQQTMYPLHRISWPRLRDSLQAKGYVLEDSSPAIGESVPYVLIIDEINRGNVSRIFGELITLLETSKRAGASEALSVTLPYSKQSFNVPSNLYLIGTMNTADRSLAGLDIALRRRFVFEEIMPNVETLKGVIVQNEEVIVDIGQMLEVMNSRIKALIGRDYQLGHAYFLPLTGENQTLERLALIFSQQIIPLLQEYFFDDWQRIGWVLNDHNKRLDLRFVVQDKDSSVETLFGKKIDVPVPQSNCWSINEKAFEQLESFASIISTSEFSGVEES